MDPVTHVLFAACMGRAGLNRKTALATATLAFAAEFPDVDVIWSWTSTNSFYAHHRGFTHTLFWSPLVALGSWSVIYGIHHWWSKRQAAKIDPEVAARKAAENEELPPELRPLPPQPVNWKLLYIYALFGTLSHLLLDFTTTYGTRPFEPVSWRWYSWDIVAIIEPWLLIALIASLILPWFFALISSEVGSKRKKRFHGQGAAIAALSFVFLFWWFCDLQHRRTIAILHNQLYPGGAVIRAQAFPYPMNPFLWYGVVETDSAFISSRVNTYRGKLDDSLEPIVRYKPEETDITRAAKSSALGKVYLDWARFPFTETHSIDQPGGGWSVKIYDLRYRSPENRSNGLTVSIRLDGKLNVVEQRSALRNENDEKY